MKRGDLVQVKAELEKLNLRWFPSAHADWFKFIEQSNSKIVALVGKESWDGTEGWAIEPGINGWTWIPSRWLTLVGTKEGGTVIDEAIVVVDKGPTPGCSCKCCSGRVVLKKKEVYSRIDWD